MNSKSKVISSLVWKFSERVCAQAVNLVVSIILARLIAPEQYGVIALTTIFITISNVFVESGLGTSLIQKKNADSKDFSTVFYCNIIMSIIMYLVIFFTAPLAAKFYSSPILTPVLRVLGITVLIAGVKSIQCSYVSKNMMFKKFFVSTFIGTVISAVIGIWMAYNGYGVWSLVVQQLSNTLFDTIILWITVKWRPTLEFSFKRLKVLYGFGWKMLCSSLIDTVYNEIYGLSIGKIYTTEQLAYYNRGNQFPKLITVNIDGSISSVMLPTLSKEQDNKQKVKNMMRRSIKTSSFLLFPLMIGLAVVAKPLVSILLTDKWLPAVPLMQLLCFSYMLWPIHTINLQAINALGRSDIFLKLEVIKKIIGVTVLIISIPFGIKFMVFMKIITSIISTFINSHPNKKLVDYSYMEQITDILPSLFVSVFMGIIVYMMNLLPISSILILIIQILLGIVIYIVLSYAFKLEAFRYIIDSIKLKLKKRKAS